MTERNFNLTTYDAVHVHNETHGITFVERHLHGTNYAFIDFASMRGYHESLKSLVFNKVSAVSDHELQSLQSRRMLVLSDIQGRLCVHCSRLGSVGFT